MLSISIRIYFRAVEVKARIVFIYIKITFYLKNCTNGLGINQTNLFPFVNTALWKFG